MEQLPNGVLLIDKPVGITSFGVVARVRKQYDTKKVGHAGTLDPLASGLMIVAMGPATKLLTNYIKLDKTYEAEVCIGESTTTADREGEVIETKTVTELQQETIEQTLADMVGTLELPVPAYSAVKQGGERLYKKARRGEAIVTPVRDMVVHNAKLASMAIRNGRAYATIDFSVASGVYIRSLAEELGRQLGYPARLENLRRTQVGEFHVEDAITL